MSQLQDNLTEILRQKNAYIIPANIRTGVTVLGVTGSMEPDKPDQTKTCTPTTSQQVISADTGYELTSVTVSGVTSAIDNNIQAANIKKDVTILGVTGTMEAGTDTSDANAVAADILQNKTAYVNGQKVTGTMYLSNSIYTNGTNTILGLTDQNRSVAFKNDALYLSSNVAVNGNTEVETKIAISDVLSVANGVGGFVMDPTESSPARVVVQNSQSRVVMEGIAAYTPNKVIANANPTLETFSTFATVAQAIGLTADKIVTGNTILGITGTGGGTTAHDAVKLFTSSSDMNNDNDKVLGDIAIVYNNNTLTGLYVVTSVNDTLTYTPLPTQLSAITSGDVYLNKVVMGANNNIVTGTIPVTASEVDTAEDTTETILGNQQNNEGGGEGGEDDDSSEDEPDDPPIPPIID